MGGFGGLIIGILAGQAPQSWTRYALDKDGRILRVTRDYLTVDEITDVDGNPIDKYKDDKYRDYQTFAENLLRGWEIGPAQVWWRGSYRSSNRYFTMLRQLAGTTWYYVAAEERIGGYSQSAKRMMGSVGPDGSRRLAGSPAAVRPARGREARWGPARRGTSTPTPRRASGMPAIKTFAAPSRVPCSMAMRLPEASNLTRPPFADVSRDSDVS